MKNSSAIVVKTNDELERYPVDDFTIIVREDDKFIKYPADDFIKKSFDRLVNNILASKYTPDLMRERVHEIYFDLLSASPSLLKFGDGNQYSAYDMGLVPSVEDIAQIIDDENTQIIASYFKQYDLSEQEIDNILAKYFHEIGSSIDLWTEDILRSCNYAYTGSAYGAMFSSDRSQWVVKLQPGQNILMKGWLPCD